MNEYYLVSLSGMGDITYYLLSKQQWDRVQKSKKDPCEKLCDMEENGENLNVFTRVVDLVAFIKDNSLVLVDELQDVQY